MFVSFVNVLGIICFLRNVEVSAECIDMTGIDLAGTGLEAIGSDALSDINVDEVFNDAQEALTGNMKGTYLSWLMSSKKFQGHRMWKLGAAQMHYIERKRLFNEYKKVKPVFEKKTSQPLNSNEKVQLLIFAVRYSLDNKADPYFYPEMYFLRLKGLCKQMDKTVIETVEKKVDFPENSVMVDHVKRVVNVCINQLIAKCAVKDKDRELLKIKQTIVKQLMILLMILPEYFKTASDPSDIKEIARDLKLILKSTVEITVSMFPELESTIFAEAVYFANDSAYEVMSLGMQHWKYLPTDNLSYKSDYDQDVRSTTRYIMQWSTAGKTRRKKQMAAAAAASLGTSIGGAAPPDTEELPSFLSSNGRAEAASELIILEHAQLDKRKSTLMLTQRMQR